MKVRIYFSLLLDVIAISLFFIYSITNVKTNFEPIDLIFWTTCFVVCFPITYFYLWVISRSKGEDAQREPGHLESGDK